VRVNPFIASPSVIFTFEESLLGFPCPRTPKLFPPNALLALISNMPADKEPIPISAFIKSVKFVHNQASGRFGLLGFVGNETVSRPKIAANW